MAFKTFIEKFSEKRVLFLSILFFSMCSCSPRPQKWDCHRIKAPCYYTEQQKFACQNDFDGLELEVTNYGQGDKVFINLFATPIQIEEPEIKLCIDSEEFYGTGLLFQGGQRFLISAELSSRILTALSQKKTIELSMLQFHATIPATGFISYF